jgi:hypothetical protein
MQSIKKLIYIKSLALQEAIIKRVHNIINHIVIWTKIYLIALFYKLKFIIVVKLWYFITKWYKRRKAIKEMKNIRKNIKKATKVKRRQISFISFISINLSSVWYVCMVSLFILFLDYSFRGITFYDKWYMEEYKMYPTTWQYVITDFARLFTILGLNFDQAKLEWGDSYFSMIYRHSIPYITKEQVTTYQTIWDVIFNSVRIIQHGTKPINTSSYHGRRIASYSQQIIAKINSILFKAETSIQIFLNIKKPYKLIFPKIPDFANWFHYKNNKRKRRIIIAPKKFFSRNNILGEPLDMRQMWKDHIYIERRHRHPILRFRIRDFIENSSDVFEHIRIYAPAHYTPDHFRHEAWYEDDEEPMYKKIWFKARNEHNEYKQKRWKSRRHNHWRNHHHFYVQAFQWQYWADTRHVFYDSAPSLKRNRRMIGERLQGFIMFVTRYGAARKLYDLFPTLDYLTNGTANVRQLFLTQHDAFYDFFVYGWMIYTYIYIFHVLRMWFTDKLRRKADLEMYMTINSSMHQIDTRRIYMLERERLPKLGITYNLFSRFGHRDHVRFMYHLNYMNSIRYSYESEYTGFSERNIFDTTEFYMSGRLFNEWLELHFTYQQKLVKEYWITFINNASAYDIDEKYLISCIWDLHSYNEPYATRTYLKKNNKPIKKSKKIISLFPGFHYEQMVTRLWENMAPTPWDQMFIPFRYDRRDRIPHIFIPVDIEPIIGDHLLRMDHIYYDALFDIVDRTLQTYFTEFTPRRWKLIHSSTRAPLYAGLDGNRSIQYAPFEQYMASHLNINIIN